MPTIRLPIKCSTAKKCDGAIEAVLNKVFDILDAIFNFAVENRVVKWGIFAAIGLIIIIGGSTILYWIGGLIFGSVIGMFTGHGHEMLNADSWYFVYGGYIGIVVGWFLVAYTMGFLKFECIDNGPKDPETTEMEENAALVNRVKGGGIQPW
jgi:hypothetical protein